MTTRKSKRTKAVAEALAAAKVNTEQAAKRMAAAKAAEPKRDEIEVQETTAAAGMSDKARQERYDKAREYLAALDRNAAVDLTKLLNWQPKGE